MTKIDRAKLAKYWRETADSDWVVFGKLKRSKSYPQSLFFLHLVIEKRLKELIVLETSNQAAF